MIAKFAVENQKVMSMKTKSNFSKWPLMAAVMALLFTMQFPLTACDSDGDLPDVNVYDDGSVFRLEWELEDPSGIMDIEVTGSASSSSESTLSIYDGQGKNYNAKRTSSLVNMVRTTVEGVKHGTMETSKNADVFLVMITVRIAVTVESQFPVIPLKLEVKQNGRVVKETTVNITRGIGVINCSMGTEDEPSILISDELF